LDERRDRCWKPVVDISANNRDDKVAESSGWKDGRWKLAERWRVNVGEGSTTPVVIGKRLYSMGSVRK